MRFAVRMIIGATLLAAAMVASSWFMRGDPVGDWGDAALYIALGGFFASQIVLVSRKQPCSCR